MNANSDNEVYAKFDDAGVNDRAKALAEVINLISDDKSLLTFKTIFLASGNSSEILRTQLKLTRKQYYSRISRLIKAGLVKRQKGRYFVIAFGKVVHNAQISWNSLHELLETSSN